MRGLVPPHQRQQLQLFSLLLTLCCTIVCTPSIGIARPDLGQNTRTTSLSTLLPPQTEDPSWFAAPPQKAYDLLTQLEKRGGLPLPGYVGDVTSRTENDAFHQVATESMMSIRRSEAAGVMPNGL